MESAVLTEPKLVCRRCVVRLVRGDITLLDVDAFVFYAQPDLVLGSGFGGAISVRGGPSIQKELTELAADGPIEVGRAVVTGGGKLKARHIIHAVGPRFREPDTEAKLLRTVESCLERAEEVGARSLAFPLMGAGYYGIPPAVSARVLLSAIESHLRGEHGLEEIVICVFDTPQFEAVSAAMASQEWGKGADHA